MKKWNEFIEWAIPDQEEREIFKVYVRNILMDQENEKALVLFGIGCNGKSTVANTIKNLLVASGFYVGFPKKVSFPIHVRGDNMVSFSEERPNPERFKRWIIEKTQSHIMCVNSLDFKSEGVYRRMVIVNFPNVPEKMEPRMVESFVPQMVDIENWFLS